MTTMLRWRSRSRAGDDGDHDGASEMEITSTVLRRWRSQAQDDDVHIISLILIACDVNTLLLHLGHISFRSKAQDVAISYHLYWLHVMFILYASYFALIDGSIIRWPLTKFQGISVLLSMHRCESSSCWDTMWWSGVIGSMFKYNGCKIVAHAEYSG